MNLLFPTNKSTNLERSASILNTKFFVLPSTSLAVLVLSKYLCIISSHTAYNLTLVSGVNAPVIPDVASLSTAHPLNVYPNLSGSGKLTLV